MTSSTPPSISVILPCYKVKAKVLGVLQSIGPEVTHIIVVDDCCPEGSGKWAQEHFKDQRLSVLFLEKNLGVGGATLAGFTFASNLSSTILVKLDGDGQMDPGLIPKLVAPLLSKSADFTKGNRFFDPRQTMRIMPALRLIGNAVLSFVNKAVSGYWDIMDPTNGFIALHSSVFKKLNPEKISNRYFFESDLLFRLGILQAVIKDIPMKAVYGDEVSNLNIAKVLLEFPQKYLKRLIKRLIYRYFILDFNIGSIELFCGSILFTTSFIYGIKTWVKALQTGHLTPTGTIMVITLPLIMGFQLLLSFVQYDVSAVPTHRISDD